MQEQPVAGARACQHGDHLVGRNLPVGTGQKVALSAEYVLTAFQAQNGELGFGVRLCTQTSGVQAADGQVEGIVVGDP